MYTGYRQSRYVFRKAHKRKESTQKKPGIALEDKVSAKEESEAERPELRKKDIQAWLVQLHHADWRLRRNAVEALGAHRDPTLIDLLLGCLTDADWEVRLQAMQALQTFRNERVTAALVIMMRDTVMKRFPSSVPR